MAEVSPLRQQYLDIKRQYPDCILTVSYTHLTLPTIYSV